MRYYIMRSDYYVMRKLCYIMRIYNVLHYAKKLLGPTLCTSYYVMRKMYYVMR